MLLTLLSLFWFVSFTDKNTDSHLALGERALTQREKWSIAIDSLDYSVSPSYLNAVRATGARICHTSRWMNGATIEADSATIALVEALPCIQSVELTRNNVCNNPKFMNPQRSRASHKQIVVDYNLAQQQQDLQNITPLHRMGYKGQGIHLAVIDGGFQNIDTLSCFDSIRSRLSIYDMADSEYELTSSEGAHGSYCLSLIGGYAIQSTQLASDTLTRTYYEGSALDATFYAIRSEESGIESPKECDNLLAAVELCDSLGVNIISVSLGYSEFDDTTFNFIYADMDGKTIRISRGFTIAANKGMLVVNAAGNEGANQWHYITAPADADQILAVGATDINRQIAPFSSRGPSYDQRVKPDVCGVGWNSLIIDPNNNQTKSGNGTSFACPLTAGMAAVLWSALPNENALQIRERIIRSAHQYDHPDDDYGYGIPDAMKAYQMSIHTETKNLQNTTSAKRGVYYENGLIIILRDGVRYSLLGHTLPNANH